MQIIRETLYLQQTARANVLIMCLEKLLLFVLHYHFACCFDPRNMDESKQRQRARQTIRYSTSNCTLRHHPIIVLALLCCVSFTCAYRSGCGPRPSSTMTRRCCTCNCRRRVDWRWRCRGGWRRHRATGRFWHLINNKWNKWST